MAPAADLKLVVNRTHVFKDAMTAAWTKNGSKWLQEDRASGFRPGPTSRGTQQPGLGPLGWQLKAWRAWRAWKVGDVMTFQIFFGQIW